MKKSLITLGCGLLLMAGMTSCNSESMHTETNTTVLCSLVTGGDAANPSVTVTEGLYTFVMDYGESTMSVSTVGVDVDGTRYNVTTDPLKVTNIADQNHGSVLRISSPSAGLATGSGSLPVTDFGCSVYGYSIYELPNIAGIQSSPVLFQPIVIRYKIGDYLVRTFSSDNE